MITNSNFSRPVLESLSLFLEDHPTLSFKKKRETFHAPVETKTCGTWQRLTWYFDCLKDLWRFYSWKCHVQVAKRERKCQWNLPKMHPLFLIVFSLMIFEFSRAFFSRCFRTYSHTYFETVFVCFAHIQFSIFEAISDTFSNSDLIWFFE